MANLNVDAILKLGQEQTTKHMQQLVIQNHSNTRSKHKSIENIKKEDLYDQLIITKKELNVF